uniref:Nuclear receptor n=1 Tax=Pristionchus pacificus TaxID=54126 RepID=A0A2A6CKH9_PRIPA|eukprot:PDM78610.1 nuclear receptor [Pristionchus pacificus]
MFRRSCFAPVPEDGIPLVVLIRGHSKFAIDFGDMPSTASERPPDPRAEADAMWSCVKPATDSCTRKTISCLENNKKVWPHADLVYAIEYLKTFEFFHRLSDDEKIHLVRWVVAICAHVTCSYFSNKMKSNRTFHPDGSMMSEKCIASSPRIREFHFDSIERLRELGMNEKEYVLLKAIIVCDPAIDGLSDYSRTMLDEQRTRYAKSLFSYMTAQRGPHNAPGRFLEMLKLIDWFRGVNERRKEHHLLRVAAGLRPNPCGTEEPKGKPVLQDEIFL